MTSTTPKSAGIELYGKHTVILGGGGTSKTACAAAEAGGARKITIISRKGSVNYKNLHKTCADAEILINTTPVGMFPNMDASPLDLTPFKACEAVLDVIYNPGETKLTAQAKGLGMKGVTGLTMLVAQAKYACELFLETTLDDAVIPVITKEIADQMYGAEEQK